MTLVGIVGAGPELGVLEVSGGQGCVHRQRYGEHEGTNISTAKRRLHRRCVVRYLVYTVHQRVVGWNPDNWEYGRVQEGLHNIFDDGRHRGERVMGSR